MGLTGFYRDFIPGYADIAAPLTNLVKKQTPKNFILEQEAEESFAKLKAALCGQPILKIPNHAKPFTLRTDASSIALGAMLMQEEKGQLFPVAYASRKLLDREQNYHISEKECLAIVWAVKRFQKYLYGVPFTL